MFCVFRNLKGLKEVDDQLKLFCQRLCEKSAQVECYAEYLASVPISRVLKKLHDHLGRRLMQHLHGHIKSYQQDMQTKRRNSLGILAFRTLQVNWLLPCSWMMGYLRNRHLASETITPTYTSLSKAHYSHILHVILRDMRFSKEPPQFIGDDDQKVVTSRFNLIEKLQKLSISSLESLSSAGSLETKKNMTLGSILHRSACSVSMMFSEELLWQEQFFGKDSTVEIKVFELFEPYLTFLHAQLAKVHQYGTVCTGIETIRTMEEVPKILNLRIRSLLQARLDELVAAEIASLAKHTTPNEVNAESLISLTDLFVFE